MKSVKIDSLHMELFSGKKTKNLILDHLIEILLLVLIIGVSIAAPSFLKSGNILNILRNAAMKGVIAYGECWQDLSQRDLLRQESCLLSLAR